MWWFHTKLSQSLNAPHLFINLNGNKPGGISGHLPSAQYSCATLFDEIVSLWRLSALNPSLTIEERAQIYDQMRQYHVKAVEKVYKIVSEFQFSRKANNNHGNAAGNLNGQPVLMCGPGKLTIDSVRFDLDSFPGFRSALEVCLVDWTQFNWSNPFTIGDCRLSPFCAQNVSSPDSLSDEKEHFALKTNGHTSDIESTIDKNSPKKPVADVPRASTPVDKRDEIEKLYMLDPSDSAEGSDPSEVNGSSVKPKAKLPAELAGEALSFVRPIDDDVEISFAQCEGLHAHGFTKESCQLAVLLAKQLLENPPDLMIEIPPPIVSSQTSSSLSSINSNNVGTPNKSVGRKKKKCSLEVQYLLHPKAMHLSLLTTSTLAKVLFLFDVLYQEKTQHKLAFRLGLWALELPRQPAASKFLEVNN